MEARVAKVSKIIKDNLGIASIKVFDELCTAIAKRDEEKRTSADEFMRLAGIIKEHFQDEEIMMTDYEIGHFGILFQQEISLALSQERKRMEEKIEKLKRHYFSGMIVDEKNNGFVYFDDVLQLLEAEEQ